MPMHDDICGFTTAGGPVNAYPNLNSYTKKTHFQIEAALTPDNYWQNFNVFGPCVQNSVSVRG